MGANFEEKSTMKHSTENHGESVLVAVPIADLAADPHNRRIDEDDDEFQSLCDSIRVLGVLQPVHARGRADGALELVDGERRW